MSTSDLRYWVLDVLVHFSVKTITCISSEASSLLLSGNSFSNGGLASTLAQLSDISTGEAVSKVSAEVHVDVGVNGTLTEVGLKDAEAGRYVGQRDVDQLIETTGTDQSLVEDVRSVGSADEEQVLFGACTVHLSEKLVKHAIGSTASVSL